MYPSCPSYLDLRVIILESSRLLLLLLLSPLISLQDMEITANELKNVLNRVITKRESIRSDHSVVAVLIKLLSV